MSFPKARTTFIVGRSGSGKSTLANLLVGFYEFSGEIRIGGNQILDIKRKQLRSNITIVQQQPQLFSEDILHNIALGLDSSTETDVAAVEDCVAFAALQDTIAQLPQGLQTSVGHLGHALSGGQRQRVALARVRLRDTPILILDEATSALDDQMAEKVMENIRAWRRNKTTIIITHNLSQTLPHDYLCVLEKGRVVQEGYRNALEQSITGPFYELSSSNTGSSRKLPAASDSFPRRISQSYSQSEIESLLDFSQSQESTEATSNLEIKIESNATASERSSMETLSMKQSFNQRMARCSKSTSRPLGRSAMGVLLTTWPYLDKAHRRKLLFAFLFAGLHAAATPIFSWCFSRLLNTYFDHLGSRPHATSIWSFAILLIAIMDGIASYFTHLYLEQCGQSWINAMRTKVFQRILDQPCSWFDEKDHCAHRLSQCLDQEAEEVRDILSRFAGSLFVAVVMMLMAIIGAFTVCWKLTLASVVLAPPMFAIMQLFKRASLRLEKSSYEATQTAINVFIETFTNIQTVKAYTLEDTFRSRHSKAIIDAITANKTKTLLSGIYYGSSDALVILILGQYQFPLSSIPSSHY